MSAPSPCPMSLLPFSAHRAHLPVCRGVPRGQLFLPAPQPGSLHSRHFHHLLFLRQLHRGSWREHTWDCGVDRWHFCHQPGSHPCILLGSQQQLLARHRIPGRRKCPSWDSVCIEGADATFDQPIRGSTHQQVCQEVQGPVQAAVGVGNSASG